MREHSAVLRVVLALLAATLATSAWPDDDGAKHLGVASCAASTCHGRVKPAEDAEVALNEYFIWSKYDHHAGAYRTLKGDWSQRIARNMGLGDPATADVCLDCHADNVPRSQRGPKFQLTDGIGCEACHGGAEEWIDSHYGPDASHADNLADGLNPTEEPLFQARMCQSCHVGDHERFVTHEMMAAGHPRLRFELDTWLANMPPHHIADADYRERKEAVAAADRWAAGMAAEAEGYLALLTQHVTTRSLTPQLSLFDCHACHQPMDTDVSRPPVQRRLMPAGTLRPDDHALQMLGLIAGLRDRELAGRIESGTRALHQAAAASVGLFRQRVQQLHTAAEDVIALLEQQPLSADERRQLRTALLRRAGDGHFWDYADAEQLFLALQALAAEGAAADGARYDRLFRLLDDERDFAPRRVAAEARRLLASD